MQPDVKLFLFDILNCKAAIESHTKDIKNYSEFMNSRLVYRAVEREIEIISEALMKIKNISEEIISTDFGKIKALRNRIVHAYDNVNQDIIWSIIKTDLLPSKEDVQKALSKYA